jgi:hypothetical protein
MRETDETELTSTYTPEHTTQKEKDGKIGKESCVPDWAVWFLIFGGI